MDAAPHRIEIIARGVMRRDGHILLCRSLAGGHAYLPGGHVEPGEPAAAALRREMHEETGLDTTPGPLLCVHEERFTQGGTPRHEINLVFHVEHAERLPEVVPSREPQIAFEWTPLSALAGAGLLPERMRGWLGALSVDAPGERGADWLPD